MKFVRLVLKNLTRNKRRTILTVFSIAVSLFIFSAMMSLPALASRILAAQASSLRVVCHNKAGLAYSLPQAYRQRLIKIPHIEAVSAWSWFGGIYREPTDQFPNFAVDHEQIEALWPDWGLSSDAVAAFKKERMACLVGQANLKRFNWKVGQQIILRGTIFPVNLTLHIVGVLGDKAAPNFLVFRRDYLDEAFGRPWFVTMYWIRTDRAESIAPVIAAVDETFANSDAETQSESEATFLANFMSTYRSIFTMAEVLGVIVVITIGLVAANTAAMSIRERRREVAVMRSIGFDRNVILSMLLSESVIIALTGCLLGAGGAYVALRVLTLASSALGPFGLILMPASVIAQSLAVAVVIGLLSGFVPARSASRQNIVDALRMVG
jgi:putative ABC transport system permease protein